jgi:SAM-dependent methyltransferase
MTETFDADWLALREAWDAVARAPRLARALSAALPTRPRLLDLGAGSGSLFRWLAPRIARAQAWTLVDADQALMDTAFGTIADWAEARGLTVTWPGRTTLLVHTPGGAWRVEGLVADLAEAPDTLPLHAADAVVNSALCDLVSAAWVERMAAALRVPFYAALCVEGHARFLPRHPGDAAVRAGFARDQARDKGFGPALGGAAAGAIGRAFTARGFRVLSAPSPWAIPGAADLMAAELARGHAAAAMAWAPRHRGAIAAWRAARLEQAGRGRLAVRVGHRDVLALPPPG